MKEFRNTCEERLFQQDLLKDLPVLFLARWLLRQGLQCCVRSWLSRVKLHVVVVRRESVHVAF